MSLTFNVYFITNLVTKIARYTIKTAKHGVTRDYQFGDSN